MVEFGDELVLDSLSIPWLIWIQLLVMFLLLLLLYSFTSSFPSADSAAAAAAAPSSSSTSSSSSSPPPLDSRGSHSHKQFLVPVAHQVGESQSVKGFIATSTSRSRRVVGEEDMMEGENSSHSYLDHHPCSLVRLARIAFLKCLGLDFTSENSSFKRHRR